MDYFVEQLSKILAPSTEENGRQLNFNFTNNLQIAAAGYLFIALGLGYYFYGKMSGTGRSYHSTKEGYRKR